MPDPLSTIPGHVTATLELSIAGRKLRGEMSVPAGPTHPAALLPLFQTLTDAVVETAALAAEARGEHVSCGAGCGACCRQLVPITEVEARRIRDLIDGLPPDRRMEIDGRFDAAKRRLDDAGMLETLRHPEAFRQEEHRTFGLAYFDLGIPCPFLEDESCSIHPDRPMVCREYLVTSPPERCAHPTAETITRLELAGKVSVAAGSLGQPLSERAMRWVPLVLAPEWADTHPDDTPPRPGFEWAEELLQRLVHRNG